MNEPQVDFSAIRGDWHFHMNYVSHAISMTLARGMKYWADLGSSSPPPGLDATVKRLAATWGTVASDLDAKGSVRIESPVVSDFIDACRSTRAPCDAWTSQSAGEPRVLANVKEFAEACRQLRGLCDDLDLMRAQKP
jgi:hypothetical protein